MSANGVGPVQRHERKSAISEDLGRRAAETEHHEWAEQGVLDKSDDRLDAGRSHRLQDDRRIRPEPCEEGVARRGDRLVARKAQVDASDVGLVHYTCDVELQSEGVAEADCSLKSLSGRRGPQASDMLNPVTAQERVCRFCP